MLILVLLALAILAVLERHLTRQIARRDLDGQLAQVRLALHVATAGRLPCWSGCCCHCRLNLEKKLNKSNLEKGPFLFACIIFNKVGRQSGR